MRKLAARSSSSKILASVVLVAGAASVAGLGTFGAFTSTTSASEIVSTETVELGKTADSLGMDVVIPALVPGDTVQRPVTLTREADTESFGSVKLTTTGSTANKLTTDTANGLKLSVDQCSVAWTVNANKTMTCSGTTTPFFANRAVIGADTDLAAATTALNGDNAASNLKLTVSLPEAADNLFQNLTNTITFAFTATQRSAESR